jgi:hypothetical protein
MEIFGSQWGELHALRGAQVFIAPS